MRTLLLFLTIALTGAAQEPPPIVKDADNKLMFREVLYDGKYPSRRLAWLENDGAKSQNRKYGEGWNAWYTTWVSCAHLRLRHRIGKHMGSGDNLQCNFTLLFFDIPKRELVGFVDLKWEGVTWGRYLASIKGEAIDYFAELRSEITPSGDDRIDSLAEALTFMVRGNIVLTQSNFREGVFTLARKGPLKSNPVGELMQHHSEGKNLVWSLGEGEYRIRSRAYSRNYEPIDTLFGHLSRTLEIFEDGYRSLRLNSDEENKERLRKVIDDNVVEISREMNALLHSMKTKNYHTMEMLHFLNQFGALVDSVDGILKGEQGTEPGFLTIIQANQ